MNRPTRRAWIAAGLGSTACVRRQVPQDGRVHLTFTTWGSEGELAALRRQIGRYHQRRPDVRVHLERIAFRLQERLDTQLAAGLGPDLFRLIYQDMGRYAVSNALIDLTPYLPAGLAAEFSPAIWSAVTFGQGVHALPLHCDTSAIMFNRAAFARAGLRAPETLATAWTWEEFLDAARRLQRAGTTPYALAMNWTFAGAYRWLNFVYQRGGQLLTDDLRGPAVPSAEAVAALRWTQQWFREGLSPLSAGVRSGEQVDQLFAKGIVAMLFGFELHTLREQAPHLDWGVTYLPHDRRHAADLGGTAVGVSRDCRRPDVAADFLLFLTSETAMREFVLDTQFLPVRRTLVQEPLPYRDKPREMAVYVEQARTMPEHLVRTVTLPGFARIHRRMMDELGLAVAAGQDAELTLAHLAREIRRVLGTAG